jgi:hypothetical protein
MIDDADAPPRIRLELKLLQALCISPANDQIATIDVDACHAPEAVRRRGHRKQKRT